jgi:hypothetical protein
VAVAAAAVRRQHSLGRGVGAGAAELHRRFVGWRARISPVPHGRQTSTGSSIASATTSRDVSDT